MVKVSVIVPVYNAQSHIENTVKCLLKQTLSDIEFIFVNDGSSDGSLEILNKYKERNPEKIIVINQENKGPGGARNSGILAAKGEYIGFVDSDDFILEDMYEVLYNKADSDDFDVVECDFLYTDGSKKWNGVTDLFGDVKNITDKKQYMVRMFPVLWNKIYKRDKVSDILFKEGTFAEDVEYLYRVLPVINTIGYVNKQEYYYYQRENSESRKFDNRIYDYISNFNGLLSYYKDNDYYEDYMKEFEFCYVRYLYATFVIRTVNFDKQ
ncbi:MAG: glycosyltransferase, partial [Bacilli bacterium]|nr:glycosyltransferase [Bacilli bacterium]